jgi:hypothetical protein
MFAKNNRRFTRRTAVVAGLHTLIFGIAAAAYVALGADSSAEELVAVSVAAQPDVDLEKAFWSCDYVGTTYGVHAAPIAFCSDVTQALREQKFGGDFGQLLEWWRQNKSAAHSAVESLRSGPFPPVTETTTTVASMRPR